MLLKPNRQGYSTLDSCEPIGELRRDQPEFHEQVDRLPESEKEVFDLLWYHALTQQEVADTLGVDVRTVKRRWRSARLTLHDRFHGEPPGQSS